MRSSAERNELEERDTRLCERKSDAGSKGRFEARSFDGRVRAVTTEASSILEEDGGVEERDAAWIEQHHRSCIPQPVHVLLRGASHGEVDGHVADAIFTRAIKRVARKVREDELADPRVPAIYSKDTTWIARWGGLRCMRLRAALRSFGVDSEACWALPSDLEADGGTHVRKIT